MLALLFQAGALLAVTFLMFSYLGWWLGTKRDRRKPAVHVLSLTDEAAPASDTDTSEAIQPFMAGAAEVESDASAAYEFTETSVEEDAPAPDPHAAEPEERVADSQVEVLADGSETEAGPVVAPDPEPEPEPEQAPPQAIAPPRPEPGKAQVVTGRLHIDPTPRGLQRQSVVADAAPIFVAAEPVSDPETSVDPVEDDLTRITGLSLAMEKQLNALGVRHYKQIAEWTPEQRDEICAQLRFPKRAIRDNWVDQAVRLSGKQEA